MDNLVMWIVAAVVAVLAGWGGAQKGKADRERRRAEEAESALSLAKVKQSIGEAADQIKDELAVKKKTNDKAKEEVIQSISDIPETKKEELGEDVKKLAADQSARARDRAKRVPDKSR
ncbi:MAG: hypothetical protein CVV52_00410 [Spirochaetae bacterium HGW-Spirochaetae-8]|nr:MAG: hypothetical protein CVV52_00410 [Spirochaetae bacterium HGW-Spirochaetae-8]